jgi:arylsulfatase A-like enzyme
MMRFLVLRICRWFVKSVIALATVICCVSGPTNAAAKSPPNIVMVYIDDAGYADFPFFDDGHPRTPHIDRLCREGIRFTQFYVNAPICSPSRVAITTGQFPARWDVTTFIASRQENANRGIRDWLDPAAPSLARMLKSAGYATGHFGKWHLGGGRDVGEAPLISEYGFDESLTQFEGLGDRVLPLLNDFDGARPRKMALGRASAQLGRGDVKWVDRSRQTQRYVRRAVEFIKEADERGTPFYINVWPDDVHTPLHPPKNLRGDGSKRALYLGVLENMDRQLGELFTHVREDESLRSNTLILVASDNGFEAGAGAAGDLRGSKGALYEGGIRVPFIVWGPGIVEASAAGSTNETTVLSSVDVVKSLLEATGVKPPAGVVLDGEDLSETMLGRKAQVRTGPLFWNRPPDRPGPPGGKLPDLAIREGQWKLLVEFDGGNPQLFDVKADPIESVNLASDQAKLVESLTSKLLAWHSDVTQSSSRMTTSLKNTSPIDVAQQ